MTAAQYEKNLEDVRVRLAASTKGRTVSVEVRIDLAQVSLKRAPDRRVGSVDIAFFSSDARERLVGELWQTLDLKLHEAIYERILGEGLRHSALVALTGMPRFVKVVVYDYASGRTGTAIVRLR